MLKCSSRQTWRQVVKVIQPVLELFAVIQAYATSTNAAQIRALAAQRLRDSHSRQISIEDVENTDLDGLVTVTLAGASSASTSTCLRRRYKSVFPNMRVSSFRER